MEEERLFNLTRLFNINETFRNMKRFAFFIMRKMSFSNRFFKEQYRNKEITFSHLNIVYSTT